MKHDILYRQTFKFTLSFRNNIIHTSCMCFQMHYYIYFFIAGDYAYPDYENEDFVVGFELIVYQQIPLVAYS